MQSKQIGIIGAGFIGGTLARKLAGLNHQVLIANSKAPSTLTQFADADNITPVWAADAVRDADILIISVPERMIEKLAQDIAPLLPTRTIVIDTGNYYPNRDGRLPVLDDGLPDSVWVSKLLGRDVFKVFNNIGAPSLKKKGTDDKSKRVGLAVAGPDGEDKNVVLELVDTLGFEPVDGGSLSESWRQQPGTPSYCKDLDPEALKASLAASSTDDIAEHHRGRDQIVDFDAAAERLTAQMK